MSSVLVVLLLVVVLGAAAVVLAVAVGAMAVGRKAKKEMELVSGTPLPLPDNWHGSHDPEAKLYRRLLRAVRGVQTISASDPTGFGPATAIEQQALRVADQLVATTLITPAMRPRVVAQLESTVSQIEHLCTEVVTRQMGLTDPSVVRELDAVAERLDLIDQARAELDQTDPGI